MHPTHNSFWLPSFSKDGLTCALVLCTDKQGLLKNSLFTVHSDCSWSSDRLAVIAFFFWERDRPHCHPLWLDWLVLTALSQDQLFSQVQWVKALLGTKKFYSHFWVEVSALECEMRVTLSIHLTEMFKNNSMFVITQTPSYSRIHFPDLSCLMRHNKL